MTRWPSARDAPGALSLRIVLDTIVLVSGLLSPLGPPGELVRLVSSGTLVLCVGARILAEYEEVLARPRFGFDPDAVAALLGFVAVTAEVVASRPLSRRLPDVGDEPFLQVALAGGADCLMTGNAAHFPADTCAGVIVLTPAQLVEDLRAPPDA